MAAPTPTTYGLLGMLASRPWTGYELTRQMRRSLRFVWPTSEGHLYREQRRLVDLGWAEVEQEPAGRRTRNRYLITEEGRAALRRWLATEPDEPHFQVEGVLRAFYGNHGTPQQLTDSLRATASMARSMLEELEGFAAEYLAEGGPMWLLERRLGGPDDRRDFHGRPMFPERLPAVALAVDVTTELLTTLERFCDGAAEEVSDWPSMDDPATAPATRERLERIVSRRASAPGGPPPRPSG